MIPAHLSYTRCKTSLCGYRFQMEQRAEADNDEPSEFATLGIVLHILAAQLAHHCHRNKRISDSGYGMNLLRKLLDDPKWGDWERDHLSITGERLAHGLTLPRDYEHIIIEQRLGVDRDYQPIKPGTPVDRFEGTPDLAWIKGKTAGLTDHKCGPGPPIIDYAEARDDRQLLAYSALLMLHHPEVEYVSARKVHWRWAKNNETSWDWQREHCLEEFRAWVEMEWEMIDRNRAEHGDGPWPAHPSAGTCEHYCNYTHICPAYLELRSRLESEDTGQSSGRKVSLGLAATRKKRIVRRRR